MKQTIETYAAPAPIGPYSQAVKAGPFLFCSGQIAINPMSGDLITETIELETRQIMRNILAIINEAGYDWGDIVKTSIFLSDMSHFDEVNKIYGLFFAKNDAPARETVAVKGLPKNVNVEISVTCYKEN